MEDAEKQGIASCALLETAMQQPPPPPPTYEPSPPPPPTYEPSPPPPPTNEPWWTNCGKWYEECKADPDCKEGMEDAEKQGIASCALLETAMQQPPPPPPTYEPSPPPPPTDE